VKNLFFSATMAFYSTEAMEELRSTIQYMAAASDEQNSIVILGISVCKSILNTKSRCIKNLNFQYFQNFQCILFKGRFIEEESYANFMVMNENSD
jgi:hypothetical protein